MQAILDFFDDPRMNFSSWLDLAILARHRASSQDLPALQGLDLIASDPSVFSSQEDRRNGYAAQKMFHIAHGKVRLAKRRPLPDELMTCVTRIDEQDRIIVWAPYGGVAVYAIDSAHRLILMASGFLADPHVQVACGLLAADFAQDAKSADRALSEYFSAIPHSS